MRAAASEQDGVREATAAAAKRENTALEAALNGARWGVQVNHPNP